MPKRPYSNAGACLAGPPQCWQHASDASVAKDQISQAGDVYVPRGIQSVDTVGQALAGEVTMRLGGMHTLMAFMCHEGA